MKRVLLLAICLLLASEIVLAQPPGSIGLFADTEGTNCNVYDSPSELITIHAVHVNTPGATACQFMVDCSSWGANLTYLGDTCPFPLYVGNSQTGITMPYMACISSPILVVTINYYGTGLSETCSYCKVVGDPTATPPGIYVADCAYPSNRLAATGGTLVINPDNTCMCDVPVEKTSWGQVKAIYR